MHSSEKIAISKWQYWRAKNHPKNLFISGPSIIQGHFVKKCLSFRYRFRFRSKRGIYFGKWYEPKKVGKETCSHRRCLHESTKYKTFIRRAWAMARPKEHPNPASYHMYVIGCKSVCNNQKRRNWPGSRVSAYFTHLLLCELGVTYTPQLRA